MDPTLATRVRGREQSLYRLVSERTGEELRRSRPVGWRGKIEARLPVRKPRFVLAGLAH